MPLLLRIGLFLTVLLLVGGAMHLYLYRRLVRDVTTKALYRRVAQIAFASLLIGTLVARVLWREAPTGWARLLMITFSTWIGFALYLFFTLTAADAAQWVVRRREKKEQVPVDLARRQTVSRIVASSAVVIGSGIGVFGTWRAFHPAEVSSVPIRLGRLPKALDGFTLVQLSDVHVGPIIQRKFMKALVEQVNALKPDMVVITGDLVDGPVHQLGTFVSELAQLQSRVGTYFVTGNHDYYSGADEWVAALSAMGITPLRNRSVAIGEPGAQFDLVGVDDWSSYQGQSRYDLEAAMRGTSPDRAAILLAHQPSGQDVAFARGIDLQLSGHTHGGQIFPATTAAQIIWGSRSAGWSRHGAGQMYVSRGCGFVGPPMRVGSPPEIVKLTLVSGA